MEMTKARTLALAGAAAVLLAASAGTAAQGSGSAAGGRGWLHVRVEEGESQSKVSVNLPISVVDAALQAAPDTIAADGHIHLGGHHGHHRDDLSVTDMRKAWAELKAAGDGEFVTVEEEDQTVRVSRSGDTVLVHVDKPSGRDEVRVEVPVDVVDALFSSQGEELNVRAAFAQLQKRRGDIVRVRDDKSTVRIWIDEGN